MPRRTLLSPEQRARLFAIPTSPAEMARHYVLSPEDLTLVQAKRRAFNRLGFAVQLCLLRHPGQGLGPGEKPPAAVLGFVAGQIGTSPEAFTDYARRDQNRREHAAELQTVMGLRSFRLSDWRDCLRTGADAAWATDRGEPIMQALLAHLHGKRALIPDAAVLVTRSGDTPDGLWGLFGPREREPPPPSWLAIQVVRYTLGEERQWDVMELSHKRREVQPIHGLLSAAPMVSRHHGDVGCRFVPAICDYSVSRCH